MNSNVALAQIRRFFAILGLFAVIVHSQGVGSFIVPTTNWITSLAVQPDGGILVGNSRLSRFFENGALDTSFQSMARPKSTLGIQSDGSIWCVQSGQLKRFDSEGAEQLSFGRFQDFVLSPDGKIFAVTSSSLVRMYPDGSLDSTFTSDIPVSGQARIAIQEDGKLLVADGIFDENSPDVRRLNADGSLDAGFQSPMTKSRITHLTPQADGKILVGGRIDLDGKPRSLARLNPDGTLDGSLNLPSHLFPPLYGLALASDGKVLISGLAQSIDGRIEPALTRLTPSGTLDPTFPEVWLEELTQRSISIPGIPLVLQGDGGILCALRENLIRVMNPDSATQSLKLDGSSITWLRGGSSPEIIQAQFQYSADGAMWTDLGAGTRIPGGWRIENAAIPVGSTIRARGYISGQSWYVESRTGTPSIVTEPTNRTDAFGEVAVFSVSVQGDEPFSYEWFKNGTALPNSQKATFQLENISFKDTGDYSVRVSNRLGSVTSKIARLTVLDPVALSSPASRWLNAGDTLNLSVDAKGTSLAYQWRKDGIPINGATSSSIEFTGADSGQSGSYDVILAGDGGNLTSGVATVRVNHVFPDSWTLGFEPTTEWFPFQSAAVGPNDELLLGGLFRTLATPARTNLIKFNAQGIPDALFGPATTGPDPVGIDAIGYQADGKIVVGGSFTEISGVNQAYLARLEPDGRLDASFRPLIAGARMNPFTLVMAIEFQADGRLLVAGAFSTVNGTPRPGLAMLLPDGSLDESFAPTELDVPFSVGSVVTQPDGKVLIFGVAGFARLNSDGTTDPTFRPAVSASYVGVFLQPDGRLRVSGWFEGGLGVGSVCLNPDGSLSDADPLVPPDATVFAVQADGKILIKRMFAFETVTESEQGISYRTESRSALLRLNSDGTEDPAVSALFDNFFSVFGLLSDGTILVKGAFTTISGRPVSRIARLKNTEAVPDSLTLSGNTATWIRSGTSLDVSRTVFEFSSDGLIWTDVGAGTRVSGGWQLNGIHLDSVGTLRARGFANGNIYEQRLEIPLVVLSQRMSFDPRTGQAVLTCAASPGKSIALETSSDLRTWKTSQIQSSGNQALTFTFPVANSNYAFFRFRAISN